MVVLGGVANHSAIMGYNTNLQETSSQISSQLRWQSRASARVRVPLRPSCFCQASFATAITTRDMDGKRLLSPLSYTLNSTESRNPGENQLDNNSICENIEGPQPG